MSKSALPIKNFGRFRPLIEQPDLNEIQLKSYAWFLKDGLREILDEVSPIPDHTGKELSLFFDDYYFGEPKYDEATTRYRDATYEAPLHIKIRLENKKTNRSEIQEIYFGDFPQMTKRGTFIINGVGGPAALRREDHPEPRRVAGIRNRHRRYDRSEDRPAPQGPGHRSPAGVRRFGRKYPRQAFGIG